MRIFGKHVFRSIKRSPLQSLLIIITLIIAAASFVVSVSSFFKIRENLKKDEGIGNYVSDITVTLSSKSDLRILFEDDLKSVVGDGGEVLGEFSLEGLCAKDDKQEFIKFYAADLEKADSFYKFKFTDYGSFTAENYKKSIIISTELAEEYQLSVGDKFSFLLLNQDFSFTVEAIALTEGPFAECGGIFSIDAVRDELAKSNPAINSFYEGFVPYSQLRVRANDKNGIDGLYNAIASDERFSDKRVYKNADEVGLFDFYTEISILITSVVSLLVIALSAIVISGSLDLIQRKRKKDTALFTLCGAERRHLNKIVYIESAIYSAFGFIGGALFARFLYRYVNNTLHWGENGLKNSFTDWIFALIASPLVMLVSVFIHLHREGQKTSYEIICENEGTENKKQSIKAFVFTSVILSASLAVTLAFPVSSRTVPAIVSMFAFLLWLFFTAPIIIRAAASLLVKILSKYDTVRPIGFMSLKNIFSSFPLRSAARLACVLLVIIHTILFSVSSVDDQVDMFENIVDCDYVAIGADEGSDKILKQDNHVKDTFRMNFVEGVRNEFGGSVVCICAEDDALPYINEEADVQSLPRGNEAMISVGLSKLYGIDEGGRISLLLDGEKYSFTVSRVLNIKSNFVFLDAEYIGFENDKLAIVANEEYSEEEQLSALTAILSPRGAGTVKFEDVVSKYNEFTKTMVNYLRFILWLAIITAVIGILNILLSAHNSRKREFSVLYISGLTKWRIMRLELREVLTLILFALLLTIPAGYALTSIFDLLLNSFGADFLH